MTSMIKLFSAAVMTCALMACEGSTPRIQPGSSLTPSTPAPTIEITKIDLLGQWDVVSFEGHAPAQKIGSMRQAFADFHQEGVRLQLECNASGVSGTVQAGRFVASPGLRAQTQRGCTKEQEQRDSRYFSFFDRSPRLVRLSDNRLQLTADQSILILKRP